MFGCSARKTPEAISENAQTSSEDSAGNDLEENITELQVMNDNDEAISLSSTPYELMQLDIIFMFMKDDSPHELYWFGGIIPPDNMFIMYVDGRGDVAGDIASEFFYNELDLMNEQSSIKRK